jgi:hypothetical protein
MTFVEQQGGLHVVDHTNNLLRRSSEGSGIGGRRFDTDQRSRLHLGGNVVPLPTKSGGEVDVA